MTNSFSDYTPEALAALADVDLFAALGAQHMWAEANAAMCHLVTVELCKLSNLEREADRRAVV